jgi:hypothetical protein
MFHQKDSPCCVPILNEMIMNSPCKETYEKYDGDGDA